MMIITQFYDEIAACNVILLLVVHIIYDYNMI